MSKTKTPPAIAAAEKALEAKQAEIAAAEAALAHLKRELAGVYASVAAARIEADANLPQCRMVYVRRYAGEEVTVESVVILRRTPGGMLVVRGVGAPHDSERRFKWQGHAGNYRQAEKVGRSAYMRELRDVPPEYIPEQTR